MAEIKVPSMKSYFIAVNSKLEMACWTRSLKRCWGPQGEREDFIEKEGQGVRLFHVLLSQVPPQEMKDLSHSPKYISVDIRRKTKTLMLPTSNKKRLVIGI